uniref:Uncharacterized protein n=1 Tax=Physcomitrium patens TaxID=3218 RepID=A0A2K1K040_PHYPA|nr:hypothetical protein PHYPA_014262 [Physcomitrium patens]
MASWVAPKAPLEPHNEDTQRFFSIPLRAVSRFHLMEAFATLGPIPRRMFSHALCTRVALYSSQPKSEWTCLQKAAFVKEMDIKPRIDQVLLRKGL